MEFTRPSICKETKIEMRTFLSILLLIGFLLSSCGSRQTKDESDKIPAKSSVDEFESVNNEEIKDCEEFIDQYEKWMDNYIKMIDKYLKNPTDAVLLSEYLKLSQEASEWMSQWNSKLYYCASKEKYQKRFNEISEIAEKKLRELGLE